MKMASVGQEEAEQQQQLLPVVFKTLSKGKRTRAHVFNYPLWVEESTSHCRIVKNLLG